MAESLQAKQGTEQGHTFNAKDPRYRANSRLPGDSDADASARKRKRAFCGSSTAAFRVVCRSDGGMSADVMADSYICWVITVAPDPWPDFGAACPV